MTFRKLLLICFFATLAACGASGRAYRTVEAPPSEPLPAALALGSWESSFGQLAIVADTSPGGVAAGAVRGRWQYTRGAETIIGDFAGTLRGSLMQVTWTEFRETGERPLAGIAFVTFDRAGQSFSGIWWTDQHDRMGTWQGWRALPQASALSSRDAARSRRG